jgi:hypothetical protein
LYNVAWRYPGEPPDYVVSVPDHGFYFPRLEDIVMQPGDMHDTSYTFENADQNEPITIISLDFYLGAQWCDPCDPNSWDRGTSGLLFLETEPNIVLQPGSTHEVPLENVPNGYGFIYVDGVIGYQMQDYPFGTHAVRHGHEETVCEDKPDADFNYDCVVDYKDFAEFAYYWLWEGG